MKYKTKKEQPEYKLWASIKRRCLPNKNNYTKEQEVGMHKEWICDYEKFKQDIGPMPKDHYFVRIDTTKGFVPDNVKWTTKKPGNHMIQYTITYNNKTEGLKYWVKLTGISYSTLLYRKKAKWDDKDIIETKPNQRREKKYKARVL
jgi:hypothetical protein